MRRRGVGDGPAKNQSSLRFGKESWAALPSLDLDSHSPFSLAMWLYQPKVVGNFAVAGQSDPEDQSRGWTLISRSRQITFTLTGEKPAGEKTPTAVVIRPMNTRRLPPGVWTHIVVTYDGSGERAGLGIYWNGETLNPKAVSISPRLRVVSGPTDALSRQGCGEDQRTR